MGSKALKIGGMIAGGIALGAALAFLLGFAVQALWNWLMPDIFGLPQITYWQAWGLVILGHILTGGGPHFNHKREEKEGFHKKLRDRFCRESGEEAPAAGN